MNILKRGDNPKGIQKSKSFKSKLEIEGQNKGNILKPKENKRTRVSIKLII